MLRNAVNRDDLLGVARLVRKRQVNRLLASARVSDTARVERAWAHTEAPITNWWQVPRVVEHRRRKVTGDPHREYADHLVDKHFAGRTGLRGLSVGCGSGGKALRWAATGAFAELAACDVAGPRVEATNRRAAEAGLDGVLRARKADVFDLDIPDGHLDVVIGEDAVHHLSPLDAFFARVERWLKPGGLLVLNEFVGPTRFQWTDEQLAIANGLLGAMPERLRTSPRYLGPRRRVTRPSLLRMHISDPSESVESGRIVPLVRERFDVIEDVPLGGTVVSLVLADIAHHFHQPDALASAYLDAMLEIEDALIASGELPSDYRLMVARRRG